MSCGDGYNRLEIGHRLAQNGQFLQRSATALTLHIESAS